jgi:hypothetical protein
MRLGTIEEFVAQTRRRILHADTSLVLVDPGLAEFLDPEPGDPPIARLDELGSGHGYARPPDDPDAMAILQFTSGSTADPKGVTLPHRCVTANLDAIVAAARIDPESDRAVSWLPLYHDMGLIGCLATPLTIGFDLVLAAPQDFLAGPARWMEWLSEFGGTMTAGPNFAYALAARALGRLDRLDLSRWRLAANGAEPIDPAAVEAFLAAGAVTGDTTWTTRALRIAERLIHGFAQDRGWRLPEHYSSSWEVDPAYNEQQPTHRFRPYGVTIGHLLEWSRLLLHLEQAVDPPPDWLLAHSAALFQTAVDIGWEADGQSGFVYMVDWSDKPVVAERMHWVAVEGVMSADALARRTGEERFCSRTEPLWANAARFVDTGTGGWWHELGASGEVSRTVWEGKPDLYHAVQALLFPDIPLTRSLVTSVQQAALSTRPSRRPPES